MNSYRTLRAVALFEATKGALVFVAGFGALSFMHRDVQRLAEELVRHLHLDPAGHYARVFIDAAAGLTDARLWSLAVAAAAYALLRLVEAYGLWRGKRWAEWFAAVSGAIYVPFEAFAMVRGEGWLASLALLLNVFIVGAMIHALRRKRDDHDPYTVSTADPKTYPAR